MLFSRVVRAALTASPVVQRKPRFYSSFFEKRYKTLLTDESIAKIYERRRIFDSTTKARSEKFLDPKRYRLVCPICEKPSIISSHECGSCNFDLHPSDVIEMKENIFRNIAQGHVTEHRIYFRNSDLVVLGDKFPIADVHLDCIPTAPIEDITELNATHVDLLRSMYETGRQVIWQQLQGSSHVLTNKFDQIEQIDPLIIAGFNLPVSVYHLHLHMIIPPLRHTNSFKFPRWHPYARVINDLVKYGRVITNKELRGRDGDHIQTDPDYDAEIQKNEQVIGLIAGIASDKRFCTDHHISANGTKISNENSSDKYVSTFFNETKENKFVPRAIFADLDPTLIEGLQRDNNSLYNPTCLIKGNEDAASNYTKGHYTAGREVYTDLLDRIRVLAEECDNWQGLIITHSIGGGTGSGVTTAMLDRLEYNFGKKTTVNIVVAPSSTYCTATTEPFNAVLALFNLINRSSLSVIVDNTAIANICQKQLHIRWPEFADLNLVIAQAISNITYSMRHDSLINTSLDEITSNLVPYPQLPFLSCAISPFVATHRAYEKVVDVNNMTRAVFSGDNSLCEFNPMNGKYLASSLMYYGDLKAQEVQSALNDIRASNTVQFAQGVKTTMKCGIIPDQPSTAPNGILAKVNKSVTMLANTTALKSVFKRITNEVQQMYNKYGFFFHLRGEGLPRYELPEALSVMEALELDYAELENSVAEDDSTIENEK